MRSRIEKCGDVLAVRIPDSVASVIGLEQNSEVELSVEGGRLIVKSIDYHEIRLQDLLDRIKPDSLHPEIETGPPMGNEAW